VEDWFVKVPGLVIVAPSNPADAKALLISSVLDDNPILYLEHKGLYASKGEVTDGWQVEPLGKASVARAGRDVTIVATMKMVREALAAAEALAKDGVEAEVIDLRTLRPWDHDAVLASVAKTRRAVVAMETPPTGGLACDVSAVIHENLFDDLAAPVKRVTAKDAPIPMAPSLENSILPSRKDIVAAVSALLARTSVGESAYA
jgi:pyruvate dehydrogenase E1 component beta subunit